MDHVFGAISKGVSLGIAVTSEAVAGRKDKRSSIVGTSEDGYQNQETGIVRSLSESSEPEDFCAKEWELDEAAPKDEKEGNPDEKVITVDEITDTFITNHTMTFSWEIPAKQIPMPVVIPQRRPKDRRRGFVRAYAPILGDAGIDQNTFIDFLNEFDKASKASPIFDVINIAAFGVGLVPSSICMIVSSTVQAANEVAREIQMRYRTNKFLDKVNDSLFKPRGLYAMVMTYKPDMADEAIFRADVSDPTSIALYNTLKDENNMIKKHLKRLRVSSGKAHGDLSIPECAPLIYPSLDLAIENQTKTPNTFKIKTEVINEYLDRRAQIEFIQHNKDSKLAAALPPSTKQYVNRFADPNHPVNSGSLFGLVSGGTFDPIASSRVRRAETKAKKNGEPPLSKEERHDAYMGRKVRSRITGTPSKPTPMMPILGKILKNDVLYLIIVNLPTEQEMMEVGAMLEKE